MNMFCCILFYFVLFSCVLINDSATDFYPTLELVELDFYNPFLDQQDQRAWIAKRRSILISLIALISFSILFLFPDACYFLYSPFPFPESLFEYPSSLRSRPVWVQLCNSATPRPWIWWAEGLIMRARGIAGFLVVKLMYFFIFHNGYIAKVRFQFAPRP